MVLYIFILVHVRQARSPGYISSMFVPHLSITHRVLLLSMPACQHAQVYQGQRLRVQTEEAIFTDLVTEKAESSL